jgi:quinol monooxygenase YgiN
MEQLFAISRNSSMAFSKDRLVAIAVLTARPGKRDELRASLLALIEPTRTEAGNLDYVLFEQRDNPGTFYMREAFQSQAALDAHIAAPQFRVFAERIDELLVEAPRLIFLDQVSA